MNEGATVPHKPAPSLAEDGIPVLCGQVTFISLVVFFLLVGFVQDHDGHTGFSPWILTAVFFPTLTIGWCAIRRYGRQWPGMIAFISGFGGMAYLCYIDGSDRLVAYVTWIYRSSHPPEPLWFGLNARHLEAIANAVLSIIISIVPLGIICRFFAGGNLEEKAALGKEQNRAALFCACLFTITGLIIAACSGELNELEQWIYTLYVGLICGAIYGGALANIRFALHRAFGSGATGPRQQ